MDSCCISYLSFDDSGNTVEIKKVLSKSVPVVTTVWGKTIYIVGKADQRFVLEEYGKLNFAIKYCNAIYQFYSAISYRPPYGVKNNDRKNFIDCISDGELAVDLLATMENDRESKYPTRKSFMGPSGTVFSGTVKCFEDTVDS